MKKVKSILTAVFLFTALAACGGGGGDDDPVDISGSYSGTLDASDVLLSDTNTYAESVNLSDVPADVFVDITVESDDFDAVVFVYDEDFNELGEDDDGAGGTDAFLSLSTSAGGDYFIIVTSSDPLDTGSYTIYWQIYSMDAGDDDDDNDDDNDDGDDDDDSGCSHSESCGICGHFSYTSCSCVSDFYCSVK